MTFARKCLDVSFSLKNGNFGSGGNSAYIRGHRVIAKVLEPGGQAMGTLEALIYGLPLTMMNQLTTLGRQYNLADANMVSLYAYEDGRSPSLVFTGTISLAFADMTGAPAACLRVSAHAGLYEAVKPVEPTTAAGSQDVSKLMKQVADKAGLRFEDGGVNAKIMRPYLPGGARGQAMALANAAGIHWLIDRGTLAIWPRGGARSGEAPLISPDTGLVGYPRFNQAGVELTTLYNPSVKFGGKVEVKSDLKPACGTWTVVNIDHELESETPKGKWFTTISTTLLDVQNAP